ELGCEVRRCEERLRGWNAVWRRPLVARLGAVLERAPADLVLVFKGTKLQPADVADLKRRRGGRWVNWFPDDPHQLGVSLVLGPAYDCFFTHDSSSLERHRRAGTRAHYLAFGCYAEFLRPPLSARPGRRGASACGRGAPTSRGRERATSGPTRPPAARSPLRPGSGRCASIRGAIAWRSC